MSERWYYCKEDDRYGPISLDELRALVADGTVSGYDPVWCSSFGQIWRKASEVEELRLPENKPAPPPLPTQAVAAFDSFNDFDLSSPSVITAAGDAWYRMKSILFTPFDITRWFSIGFCAWLASIGSGGGGINGGDASQFVNKDLIDKGLERMVEFIHNPAKLSLLIVATLLLILFGVFLLGLRSRGDFMFIRRWYNPDHTVGDCWSESQENAMLFFRWRIYFFGALLAAGVINLAYVYSNIVSPYVESGCLWDSSLYIGKIAAAIVVLVFILLVESVGDHLSVAFVVPVIYWHSVSVKDAWSKVFQLCNQFPGAIIRYWLCLIGLWMLATTAIGFFMVVTCCIGAIIMSIPYLGAVLMLPVSLFFRGYSICFISQWRSNFIPGYNSEM